MVINWERADVALAELRELKQECGVSICLSRVNRKDAAKHAGSRFNHLISHGFAIGEAEELADFLERNDADGTVSALLVAVPRDQSPWTVADWARGFGDAIGRRICLYVKSSASSPAEAFVDDAANAWRTAISVISAAASPGLNIILDTFTDADRGYFVRTGLVDRRYNPRPAGRVVSALVGELGRADWRAASDADVEHPAISHADGRRLELCSERPGEGEGEKVIEVCSDTEARGVFLHVSAETAEEKRSPRGSKGVAAE